MRRVLTDIIAEQTRILLFNISTTLITCDSNFVLCGQPIWKHAYHAIHSCDQWFINPTAYMEPPFHKLGLNSLDILSEKALSGDELVAYAESVTTKVLNYLETLNDDMLAQKPEGCPYTRLALILGQYRHLYAHLGNINATTMIQTDQWPRVVGLDGDFSNGLYE